MTWTQTRSGRAMDLLRPDPRDVDFDVDIPTSLGRIPRYLGATDLPYSVAQHCCHGADVLMRDRGAAPKVALAFLLHDAHEAYMGDITSPAAEALAYEVDEPSHPGQRGRVVEYPIIRQQIARMKERLDKAIYRAAGFEHPPTHALRFAIHVCDLRMLATERAHLLGPAPKPWHPTVEAATPYPWRGKLKPWSPDRAADEWRARFRNLSGAAKRTGPRPRPPAAMAVSQETA